MATGLAFLDGQCFAHHFTRETSSIDAITCLMESQDSRTWIGHLGKVSVFGMAQAPVQKEKG